MKLQIIDMIIILSDYPECITESAKLKAILTDLFPDESKGSLNVMVTIAKSGISQEIQNSASHDTIGKMETGRWVTRLASEYCMSGDTVNECIGLWVDSLKWLAEQKTGKYFGSAQIRRWKSIYMPIYMIIPHWIVLQHLNSGFMFVTNIITM